MAVYHIKDLKTYEEQYRFSVDSPDEFWAGIASENFVWKRRWDRVSEFDMHAATFKWFDGAQLNITENCLDRHLEGSGDATAIIFEPNDPAESSRHISYRELHRDVCKMANVLLQKGIQKGDRVCIYLPMIPELAISVLACARIGAVHSVVFAGFSSNAVATRINDCQSKMVITADGVYRGAKKVLLKPIIDVALNDCPSVENVLVAQRTNDSVTMVDGRDYFLEPLLEKASEKNDAATMNAEDPLFILYTSGSTGKPKGMMHTIAGYMVYTAYTFQNIFNYQKDDVFWCTADIGWITGHSYIVYGPLLNGATTVIFEGIPTFPDSGRFWEVIQKHQVTQFYTAPTAIRSLAKEDVSWVLKHDLSSLKIIGSVGEPINDEAWHWYDENVGKKKCPIVDTWWQTETGGVMISAIPFVTDTKPTYATLPLPGIQPSLIDENKNEISDVASAGNLCINYPWPSIARTIWGDHKRFIETYFTAYPGKYFTGDGALRDKNGFYRITGRVDDVVIVSGHNLGTAPIEDAIDEHEDVAEAAVVGYPHDIKGNALYGFVILKDAAQEHDLDQIRAKINSHISEQIGPIAKLDKMQFVSALPKTRSGKIMRRILRKIAEGDFSNFGDTTTLLNPEIVDEIRDGKV